MDDTIAKSLRRFDFFEGLSDELIEELAGKVLEKKLAKDEILFRKGDEGDSLYIIRHGWLKIVSEDKAGGEVTINQVGPGNVIGEMALIDNEPRSVGVVGISEVDLLCLGREEFLSVLYDYPELALQVTRSVIQRLRFSTTYIENAIEWSKRIAAGDYSFLDEQKQAVKSTIVETSRPDAERANRFLATFFRMVEDIKAREDALKQQLQELKIQIDQTKREQDVNQLASSEFFQNLRTSAKSRRHKGEEEDN